MLRPPSLCLSCALLVHLKEIHFVGELTIRALNGKTAARKASQQPVFVNLVWCIVQVVVALLCVVQRIRFYRKLARKQQLVWFGHVDATAHPELARDLGMKAVPGFVTFRGGEVVTATNTNSKQKIENLVKELLLA